MSPLSLWERAGVRAASLVGLAFTQRLSHGARKSCEGPLPVRHAQRGRSQRAGVAEEVSSLSQARRSLEATGQALAFRLKDDYLMAETSYRLMEIYSSTVIPQSSLALQASLAAYETGGVDFLTVLANFTTMLDYELNYHEELQSYFLALARLEEMTGMTLT